ncbi:MAG: tetratricopeptide repeat protein [Burkholderiaceae bacterium]
MPSIRSLTSSFTSSFTPISLLRLLPATFALSAALFAVSVHASDIDDVNQLLKAGKQAQALTKVEQSLTTKPRDPQLRFLKGVIQTELGKPQDAIGTFTKLTEEYPELPEPYNNLAVLHASGGQFDKARAALEMAIRTNPSYSTAHENLGDIYANLASQAYSKALQLGGSSSTLQPKLTLIRELFAPGSKGVNPNAAKPVATAPVTPAVVAPTAPVATAPAKPVAPIATAPVAPTPAPALPAAVASSDKDIEQAVQAWAKAWSSKDMNAYLGAYAKNFDTPKNLPRKAWEEERRDRIMGKSRISVKVSDLVTKTNGNTAVVKFRQSYDADALSTSSRKTLELNKVGDRWLIAKETTGG